MRIVAEVRRHRGTASASCAVAACAQSAVGPTEDTGDVVSTFVGCPLATSHAGIVATELLALVSAVISERSSSCRPFVGYEDGLVVETLFFERGTNLS